MIPVEKSLVGFEATALELPHRSGVGHYTAQLLDALLQQNGDWRYAILASRQLAGTIPQGIMIPPSLPFLSRSLWIQLVLPRMVARLRPHLCHFTNSLAPLSLSCPYVVTIYDVSLHLFPRLHPRKSLLLVRSLLPAVVRRAKEVITISHSAKGDIVRVLKVPPEMVHVVYGAPGHRFFRPADRAALEHVRHAYGLESPYVLTVSTLEPRKNLPRLVRAFEKLRHRGRAEHLVLVGQPGWHYRPLLRQIERSNLKRSVRLLGYVPPEDLPAIYQMARAVAFPSLYEGFGLPIVEAMACGTPVLTSARSSMAELGSGAALLVDPTSEDEITHGLVRLLTEEPLREELRAAGRLRSLQFSWTRAAQETAVVYRSAIT